MEKCGREGEIGKRLRRVTAGDKRGKWMVGGMSAENPSWLNRVKTCGSYTLYTISRLAASKVIPTHVESSHEAHNTHMCRQSYTWILIVYNASTMQSSIQFTLYMLTKH